MHRVLLTNVTFSGYGYSMSVYYILYISVASQYMNEDELGTILSVSRRNNRRDELTGVLLYGNGRFIQLLEGDQEIVSRTFERLRSDRRHLDLTVIASGNLAERCFPDWFMGFKAIRPESYSMIDGFLDLTKKPISEDDCELPVRLLQSFVKKNKLNAR